MPLTSGDQARGFPMMKVLAVGLAAACCVGLAGCGSSSSGAGDPRSQTTSVSPAKGLTEVQAKAALLTSADLPSGYAVSQSDGKDEQSKASCGIPDPKGYAFTTNTTFGKSAFGPFIIELIRQFPTESAAKADIEYFRKSTGCGSYTDMDNGMVKLSALSFPKRGDESTAYRQVTSQGAQLDFVFIRVGTTNFGIGCAGLGSTPDVELIEKLSDEAVKRIKTQQHA